MDNNIYCTRQEVHNYCHAAEDQVTIQRPNEYATYNDLNELGATLVDGAPTFANNQLVPSNYIIPKIRYQLYPNGGQSASPKNLDIRIQNFSIDDPDKVFTGLDPTIYIFNGYLDPSVPIVPSYNDYDYGGFYSLYTYIISQGNEWIVTNLNLSGIQLTYNIKIKSIYNGSTKYQNVAYQESDSKWRLIFQSAIPYGTPSATLSCNSWDIDFYTFSLGYTYDSKYKSITSTKLNWENGLRSLTTHATYSIVYS